MNRSQANRSMNMNRSMSQSQQVKPITLTGSATIVVEFFSKSHICEQYMTGNNGNDFQINTIWIKFCMIQSLPWMNFLFFRICCQLNFISKRSLCSGNFWQGTAVWHHAICDEGSRDSKLFSKHLTTPWR